MEVVSDMRARIERTFYYPCDDVCRVLMDSGDVSYDMQELPNVTAWKVLEEIEGEDDVRRGKKEWNAHGQIPRALQHIITPKMLSFIEHSEWDRKARTYRFRIEPHYLKHIIDCHGTTTFVPKSDKKTTRIFDVIFQFKMPILGPIFEQAIMGYLKKNEAEDARLCESQLKTALNK